MIYRIVVSGIVFNPEGKILMIKHKKLGVWLPPGGHVENDESPDDAVFREIFEETGIKTEIISIKLGVAESDETCVELASPLVVLLEDINGKVPHKNIDLIYVCMSKNSTITPNLQEVDDARWFSAQEIETLETNENIIKVIYRATDLFNNQGYVYEEK